MQSALRFNYDALLALRAPGSPTITATAASSQVDINLITQSARHSLDGLHGELSFTVVLQVVSADHTTGDETYSVAFNVYDENGANPVTLQTYAIQQTDIGNVLYFPFDANMIEEQAPNVVTSYLTGISGTPKGAFFGLNVTLAGTTPILGYYAFIAPNHM